MTFAMHLVTDRDAGDPVGADVLARLGAAFPDADVRVTRVARGDTLEAGAWVARIATSHDAAGCLVGHDVASGPGQPDPWPAGAGEHMCVGTHRGGRARRGRQPRLDVVVRRGRPAGAVLLGRPRSPAPPTCRCAW
jgi:hypothetical protein